MGAQQDQAADVQAFGARLALTLGIELLLALAFCFRTKAQLVCIVCMNLITQVGLNQAIGHLFPRLPSQWDWPLLLVLELLIFLVEGAVYAKFLPRWGKDPAAVCHPWLYALAANAASFGAGLVLARFVPGWF